MSPEPASKHIIIGTAGHVDHGKTTLIHALTGIDTDRLKEEKERGMTIDLGFASLKLPSGRKVGIVDVPGHERFLKNMLAGATGVDIALLVVAADEGVMPQTREHLDILRLLETKRGVIALTKVDMVDEDWLDMVEDDLQSSFKGTFLEDSPIVRVSGVTGEGAVELLQTLDRMVVEVDEKSSAGPFRLPVDRVFTITGFGTVVTGTLVSGTIRVGDAANILPKGIETRVRNVQVHNEKLPEASAGSRVAINLAGVDVSDIARGDVLVPPGYLEPSQRVDMLVKILSDAPKPLQSRTRVRMHTGTSEILGRITVLDLDVIEPGKEGFVQFTAESPMVTARGDRFVLRSYSPMRTIGGGIILEPKAEKHRKQDSQVIEKLKTKLAGGPRDILESALISAQTGITVKDLAKTTGLDTEITLAELDTLGPAVVWLDSDRAVHSAVYQSIAGRIASILESYHESYPLRAGMPREEMRTSTVKGADAKVFGLIINKLEHEGRIVSSDKYVKLTGFAVKLDDQQNKIAESIETRYRREGLNTSTADEVVSGVAADASSVRSVFDLLVEQGKLIKIEEGLYVHQDSLEKAEGALRNHLAQKGKITVSEFRDLTGTSRKYAVPLLEYFDTKRVTRRVGDERVLFGR